MLTKISSPLKQMQDLIEGKTPESEDGKECNVSDDENEDCDIDEG